LSETEKRTEETLLNHLRAFGRGDLDAVMTDYDEDAVFITPEGTRRGSGEIRSLFESLLADLPPGSDLKISQQIIEGEVAFLVWSGESENLEIPFATDTLIVRNGKIVTQTFAAQMETKFSA
jgi:ketosteroid isomerase-like protein